MPIYCPPPSPDEIYHHGILGQKWGKRNGPPYPLGASDHSSSERKAGWKKSLDGKPHKNRHQRAAEASQRDADNLRKHGYTKEADAVQKVADKHKDDAIIKEQKRIDRLKSKNPNKVVKNLQRELNKAKGSRLVDRKPIGSNSEKEIKKQLDAYKKWTESDEHKRIEREWDNLDRQLRNNKISVKEYDARSHELFKKENSTRPPGESYRVTSKGRIYTNEYVKTFGKDLTIAYLKDLGYTETGAEELQRIIQKSNIRILH